MEEIKPDLELVEAQDFLQNLKDMEHTPVQEIMIKELLEVSDDNEMIQALDFVRQNGVPLTTMQVAGTFQLIDAGITDVFTFINSARKLMTPTNKFYKLIDKLTLADRIKGNAKLSNLLKANANPANSVGVPMSIEKGSKG
ncbi:hypothetical protein ACFWMP_26080 [Paenibacillus sp. NPDC058367]|uniref:hypothetical protein n=1 Tax=Paenibacillus sp. NPDC058367 TaxID=3346460 RepID=UPI003665978A